jgi:hypothetical protein
MDPNEIHKTYKPVLQLRAAGVIFAGTYYCTFVSNFLYGSDPER